MSYYQKCPVCGGSAYHEGHICYACRGKGTLFVEEKGPLIVKGDYPRPSLAWELSRTLGCLKDGKINKDNFVKLVEAFVEQEKTLAYGEPSKDEIPSPPLNFTAELHKWVKKWIRRMSKTNPPSHRNPPNEPQSSK